MAFTAWVGLNLGLAAASPQILAYSAVEIKSGVEGHAATRMGIGRTGAVTAAAMVVAEIRSGGTTIAGVSATATTATNTLTIISTTTTSASTSSTNFPPTSTPYTSRVDVVDTAEYSTYKGSKRQVYVTNWDIEKNGKINPRTLIDGPTKSAQYFMVKNAMKNALLYFYNRSLSEKTSADNIESLFKGEPIESTVREELNKTTKTPDEEEKTDVFCAAQPHSQYEGENFDPIMYCDESGFSIRLHNAREETLSIKCLDAAKVAYELSLHLAVPPLKSDDEAKEWVHTGKPIATTPDRIWETIGHTFWSEDSSWFVYIGREPIESCKFKSNPVDYWPAFRGVDAGEVDRPMAVGQGAIMSK
ncbi:hypothetical protein TWF730_002606 [Orbilia blumenaviensis]|uniref:Uncharacterized protein n=1 Tax=Orbilia blumenaviensis TaxID=1796055 RepID=A0AAV9UAM1_9PEZI